MASWHLANNYRFAGVHSGLRPDPERRAQIMADLQRDRETRQQSYRDRALKLFPQPGKFLPFPA